MPNSKNSEPSAADHTLFERALSPGGAHLDHGPDIDMRIARDGTWFYHGSAISRKPLVRLFSTVLRREADGEYYLVTPVERVRIDVDDAPFTAVEMFIEGSGEAQSLSFRTNVDDIVVLDAEHPLRVEIDPKTGQPAPYIRVRDNLEALIVRAVFYDLVDLGLAASPEIAGQSAGQSPLENGIMAAETIGVWSAGMFFEIGKTEEGSTA